MPSSAAAPPGCQLEKLGILAPTPANAAAAGNDVPGAMGVAASCSALQSPLFDSCPLPALFSPFSLGFAAGVAVSWAFACAGGAGSSGVPSACIHSTVTPTT